MQFLTDIQPNQQGHEGADLGVIERGCHPIQAFVHRERIQLLVELLMDLVNDGLQVRVDRGLTLAGVKRCRTGHAPERSPG